MRKITKVDAIKKVMQDNGGVASWEMLYDNVEKYYPAATKFGQWQAGLRGVVFREIKNNRNFKKIGLGIYALRDYQEERQPDVKDTLRMHSFIEGVCVELGNIEKFLTYTADPSATFKDNIKVGTLTSLKSVPDFTYPQIISETKRIDVVWFNRAGYQFPQKVFEVVDSPNTLANAFNRSLQLLNFKTEFYIVAPQQHEERFNKQLRLAPYNDSPERFRFVEYGKIINLYENAVKSEHLKNSIFTF